MRSVSRPALFLVLAALTGACATVGPDYQRPAVDVPSTFRDESGKAGGAGQQSAQSGASAQPSIANAEWSAVFTDERLRELITTALQQNYDVRIAAARILQAEAALGLTRANQFPTVDAQAVGQGQRTSVGTSDGEARLGGVAQLGASAAWEVDFWGRYRRGTEAARAELVATEWGRRAVMTRLVSQVAAAYYTLLALDRELEIATRTLATREESLRITQIREAGGATSLVDVRQAEQLVYGAQATIVDLRQAIEQQENFLSVLLGQNPGPIPRGRPLSEQVQVPEIPAGLPSELLERRADIQQAEQLLVAANADIGVARSSYFPRVALTGSGGFASSALSALFSGPAAAWTAAASVVQPVFNAGRIRSDVALAEARREEATLAYQATVQQAFREVSDALVAYRRTRELRATQEQLVRAAQDARRLADLRYQGGAASYLEVLDSDTRLFSAELALVRAELDELTAFVEIYRALGGGWQ
jgi:multidrug efflux system outer membrane protein